MPFHVWATRNIPFYAATLAQNPYLIRGYLEYKALSKQQQQSLNLTSSYNNKLSIGNLPALLVGENNLAWINPTVAVSVFDQTKGSGVDPNANAFEKAIGALGRVGLSPAPWIPGIANMLGYTHDAGAQAVFNPISGPVKALTGVNLDYPTNRLQEIVRNAASGLMPGSTYVPGYKSPSGDPYTEYNIDKRIDQMSVEYTGHANDPLFERAKAIPDSLIYKQAASDVAKDNRLSALWQYFIPIPLTTTNNTELAIRQAAAQLPAKNTPEYQAALDAGDIGTAHSETSFGDPRKTQIEAGINYMSQYGWPSNGYSQQYGTAHYGASTDIMAFLFKNLPWFKQYYTWLQIQPEGADTTVKHFLATNRNANPQ